MVYEGYLDIAGIEVFNAPRTAAYLRNAGLGMVSQKVYEAPDLPAMLLQGDYRTPALDGAPWFRPYEPDSGNFYGWFPTGWTGFSDSTLSSAMVELTQDGAVASIPRESSKELRIKGILFARDEHALAYGMSWLRGVFMAPSRRSSDACEGESMTFFSSTPEMCEEAVEPVIPHSPSIPYHECAIEYLRQYLRISTIQGPKVVASFSEDLCPQMVEVEVILSAGNPHCYAWPRDVGESQLSPARTVTNLIRNPRAVTPVNTGTGVTDGITSTRASNTVVTTVAVPAWGAQAFNLNYTPATYTGSPIHFEIAVPDFVPGARTYTVLADVASSAAVSAPGGGQIEVLYRTGGPSQTAIASPKLWTAGTGITAPPQQVRWEFSIPATATDLTVRFYAGARSLYVTHVLVAASADLLDGGYFDGAVPDTENWNYSWTGTADNSPSEGEFNPAPPFTVANVVCDPSADPVVLRNNLALTPGPDADGGWLNTGTSPGRFTVSRVDSGTLVTVAAGYASTQAIRSVRTSTSLDENLASLRNVGGSAASARIPISGTAQLRLSLWLQASIASTEAYLRVRWFNAAGSVIGTYVDGTVQTMASAATWYRRAWTFTPVAGAATMEVSAVVRRQGGTAAASGQSVMLSSLLVSLASETYDVWFDGSTAADEVSQYRWLGLPFESASQAVVQTEDALRDPDCTFVPPAPQPPAILDDCLETPPTWTRYSVQVPVDLPGYAAVPLIELSAGAVAIRQVRLRMYADDDGAGAAGVVECDWLGEWIVTYLPANSTMVLDGRLRTAYVDFGTDRRSALHLLRGSDGKPFVWPVTENGRPYVLTADFVPASPDTAVRLAMAGKV